MPPWFGRGSYPIQDLGVHGLYLLEAFLGPLRKADLRYRASGLGDPNLVFDEWRGMAESDSATGSLYISWNARPIRNELIVHGTRGAIQVDCFLQTLAVRKTWPAPKPVQCILNAGFNSVSTLWNVTVNTLRFATKRLLPSPGIHVSVVKFHEALHAGEAPPVPAQEGRRAIALLEEVSRRADADKKKYLAEARTAIGPRILVTGANGFLGRAFVKRLREECGQTVRLLVRRPPAGPAADDVEYCYGDLGNPAVVDRAMEGIDTVFHIGAAMKGGNFEYAAGTTWGTRNIVEACRKHGVRKLVYVSSLSVFDHAGHARGAVVNEFSPYEPHPAQRGLYTQTKLEAEKMVLQAASDGEVAGGGTAARANLWAGYGRDPTERHDQDCGPVAGGGVGIPLRSAGARGECGGRIAIGGLEGAAERIDLQPGGRGCDHAAGLRGAGAASGPGGAGVIRAGVAAVAGGPRGGTAGQGIEAAGASDAVPRAVDYAVVAVRFVGGAGAIGMEAEDFGGAGHGGALPGEGGGTWPAGTGAREEAGLIITRSPLRISLGGGGTDLPSYYREHTRLRDRRGDRQVRLHHAARDRSRTK